MAMPASVSFKKPTGGAQAVTYPYTVSLQGFKKLDYTIAFTMYTSLKGSVTFKNQSGTVLATVADNDEVSRTLSGSVNLTGVTSLTVEYYFWSWTGETGTIKFTKLDLA